MNNLTMGCRAFFISLVFVMLSAYTVTNAQGSSGSIKNDSINQSNKESSAMKIEVIGNSFKVAFASPYVFKLDFHSETSMTFTPIAKDGTLNHEESGSVEITRVEIRPNVYMVYWSEPFNGDATVTHVQDFENGKVWTNITMPAGPQFINMPGTLTPYEN